MRACWNCGAHPRWYCGRCGSTEQRPDGKGCAECNRRRAREYAARRRRGEEDFPITPAMRAYLAAFDRFLQASKTGDPVTVQAARDGRAAALERLETAAASRQTRQGEMNT